jgi:intracellular septation protein A
MSIHRRLVRQLVPGLVLPGTIYFVVSRHAPVLLALAAASTVPLIEAVIRLIRRRPLSPVGLVFLAMTGISVALALWLRSPMFILVKGAVLTALVGLAFAGSAVVRRPLTRTLALRLSTDHREGRRRLAERWRHPVAHSVFCTLSVGWGVLLLLSAAQQGVLAFTLPPGMVMALEPPVQLVATALGVTVSILYVRRRQRLTPELGLLPVRTP